MTERQYSPVDPKVGQDGQMTEVNNHSDVPGPGATIDGDVDMIPFKCCVPSTVQHWANFLTICVPCCGNREDIIQGGKGGGRLKEVDCI